MGTETYRSFAGIMFYEGQLQTNPDATLTVSFMDPPETHVYLGNLPEVIDGIWINTLSSEGFWNIEPVGVSDAGYSISLRAGGFDGIEDPSGIRILKRNDRNDDWVMAGEDSSYGTSGGDFFFLQQNVNGFSEFALGSDFDINPLPVDWLSFEAEFLDGEVLLTWQTATEINNDFFTILRSTDGMHFQSLGKLPGAGDSNQVLSYSFTDNSPLPGTNYYRIRQTDYDGSSDYSNIVALNITESSHPHVFYHNQQIHFNLPCQTGQDWTYQIFNPNGMLVDSGRLPATEGAARYTWYAYNYTGQLLIVALTCTSGTIVQKVMVR